MVNFIVTLENSRDQLKFVDHYQLLLEYDKMCLAIKDIPCPFLDRNSCTIYEHRPLVCRTYGRTYEITPNNVKRYNTCKILSHSKYYTSLIDGTKLGAELFFLRFNKDLFPLLIWLVKASHNLTFIPNEHREFKDDFITLEEFRIIQKAIRFGDSSLTAEELTVKNRVINLINS